MSARLQHVIKVEAWHVGTGMAEADTVRKDDEGDAILTSPGHCLTHNCDGVTVNIDARLPLLTAMRLLRKTLQTLATCTPKKWDDVRGVRGPEIVDGYDLSFEDAA